VSSQPVRRHSYNVDFCYIYPRVVGEAQAESSLTMVCVNRNMLEQLF
jgi:hypothetical protein